MPNEKKEDAKKKAPLKGRPSRYVFSMFPTEDGETLPGSDLDANWGFEASANTLRRAYALGRLCRMMALNSLSEGDAPKTYDLAIDAAYPDGTVSPRLRATVEIAPGSDLDAEIEWRPAPGSSKADVIMDIAEDEASAALADASVSVGRANEA